MHTHVNIKHNDSYIALNILTIYIYSAVILFIFAYSHMYDQKLIMHDEDVYFVNMFIREVHIYNVDTLLC